MGSLIPDISGIRDLILLAKSHPQTHTTFGRTNEIWLFFIPDISGITSGIGYDCGSKNLVVEGLRSLSPILMIPHHFQSFSIVSNTIEMKSPFPKYIRLHFLIFY